ncbi:MAG: DNA/RNA non-specific endonuclease [Thomasclavelia sp.]|nr:DNA/RNA non-specific endonuclease [Thomasclavelia sp.]
MKRTFSILISFLLCISLVGCTSTTKDSTSKKEDSSNNQTTKIIQNENADNSTPSSSSTTTFDVSSVPAFSGKAYVAINNNNPYFTKSDYTTTSFEKYSSLDSLGRCSFAYACVGKDIMPTTKRGSIGSVKPTGWQTIKYDSVDGKYLYNRCHLLAYELTGENANNQNLITGTRYLNINGMLPFENMIADHIKEVNDHVMYRVTPIFEGNNLVASGVLMEGYSVEDNGAAIKFCVYVYNVQPGITIDYSNGNSSSDSTSTNYTPVTPTPEVSPTPATDNTTATYVLNTNTKVFHKDSCWCIKRMADKNKQIITTSPSSLEAQGYSRCKVCNP